MLDFSSCELKKRCPSLNTPPYAGVWPRSVGSARAMCKTEAPAPGAPVINGPVRSKAKPSVWLCPRSNTSGSAQPSGNGAKCKRPFNKCNGSAARSYFKRCPIHLAVNARSEEHTSELQSQSNLVCRLLLEKKKKAHTSPTPQSQYRHSPSL